MNIVKQLSVFLENKTGRINELARILGENGINMTAFSTSDNPEFGIMRMIVSDAERAAELLRASGFGVNISDVLHVYVPNTSGALSRVLEALASHNIFIEYMYAFSDGDEASVVIRTGDLGRSIEILKESFPSEC
ncbi:amino acid-binding protein [Bacteroidia bacterium]|nr:amino acid-binding protein [Bacteroidia bacterium]